MKVREIEGREEKTVGTAFITKKILRFRQALAS